MKEEMSGDEILEKLKDMAATMTPEGMRRQKISFIKGTLDSEMEISDERIEEILDRFKGTEPA